MVLFLTLLQTLSHSDHIFRQSHKSSYKSLRLLQTQYELRTSPLKPAHQISCLLALKYVIYIWKNNPCLVCQNFLALNVSYNFSVMIGLAIAGDTVQLGYKPPLCPCYVILGCSDLIINSLLVHQAPAVKGNSWTFPNPCPLKHIGLFRIDFMLTPLIKNITIAIWNLTCFPELCRLLLQIERNSFPVTAWTVRGWCHLFCYIAIFHCFACCNFFIFSGRFFCLAVQNILQVCLFLSFPVLRHGPKI